MIGWEDVYKVVEAMVPLYFALGLGYGSVRWWGIFTPEQCEAVNRLVAYFAFPMFTFDFTLHIDPFAMNYRFLAADAVSKVVVIVFAAAWAKMCPSKGGRCWSITSFSLATLTNSLVVGVPLANAMYGRWAQDLMVQLSVVQAIVWLTLLMFVFEIRKAEEDISMKLPTAGDGDKRPPMIWSLTKTVSLKLAQNPNTYASVVGMTWAFVANRWHLQIPSVIEGSVLIMSRTGTGMAMFSIGLFMALQKSLFSCGPSLTAFSMVLKFIAGPAAAAIGALALGLHGDMLNFAIIQGALPQSITSFVFAKEYGLHADVLSTAVIFGMLVSLPIVVAYYAVLGLLC